MPTRWWHPAPPGTGPPAPAHHWSPGSAICLGPRLRVGFGPKRGPPRGEVRQSPVIELLRHGLTLLVASLLCLSPRMSPRSGRRGQYQQHEMEAEHAPPGYALCTCARPCRTRSSARHAAAHAARTHASSLDQHRAYLTVEQVIHVLTGICRFGRYTVTANGEPRISGVDGYFLHASWWSTLLTFGSSARRPHRTAGATVVAGLGVPGRRQQALPASTGG
jgi:hypothetical protein